jgi:chromosome segregation and condensation protein ScpB
MSRSSSTRSWRGRSQARIAVNSSHSSSNTALRMADSAVRRFALPQGLSKAALEVLAIVAYRQPIARSGIELIRGSASDSALDTLLERGLIAHNPHHLFVTTRAFLGLMSLRNLADLPPLVADRTSRSNASETNESSRLEGSCSVEQLPRAFWAS